MANHRVRWIADARTLYVNGGGIPVGPGAEFMIDELVAADLVTQEVAIDLDDPPT